MAIHPSVLVSSSSRPARPPVCFVKGPFSLLMLLEWGPIPPTRPLRTFAAGISFCRCVAPASNYSYCACWPAFLFVPVLQSRPPPNALTTFDSNFASRYFPRA
jgi:hypothetical protein